MADRSHDYDELAALPLQAGYRSARIEFGEPWAQLLYAQP
jgi:hypothetical protein